ncbi:MAG TPA: hypothetical protein VEF76_09545 [Patescibacteria group bacterium]|nr:hypothetical protein [Patescibacteria group bacterium]
MISRVLLPAAVVAMLALGVTAAQAANAPEPPGCNPQVTDAMATKAQALVGYDNSVVAQTMDKPDSVLAMTCFEKAAGLDGAQAGKIFSEDFMDALRPMVEPFLASFYTAFDGASGFDSSMPSAYTATTLVPNDSDCDFVTQFWDGSGAGGTTGYKNEGVQQGVPFITMEMLRGLQVPSGGTDFDAKWGQIETLGNVLTNFDTSFSALPRPTTPTGGFLNQNSICAVLTKGGLTCP